MWGDGKIRLEAGSSRGILLRERKHSLSFFFPDEGAMICFAGLMQASPAGKGARIGRLPPGQQHALIGKKSEAIEGILAAR